MLFRDCNISYSTITKTCDVSSCIYQHLIRKYGAVWAEMSKLRPLQIIEI
jgi:hypothetical protein